MNNADRFWNRVVKGPGCWSWIGYHRPDGYAMGTGPGRKPRGAHRIAYELANGPVPDGLQLDHLCRHRWCVNPGHLEPVTVRQNVLRGNGSSARRARQTHCKQGHPLAGSNLHIDTRGYRRCKQCKLDWYHAHKHVAEYARLEGQPAAEDCE